MDVPKKYSWVGHPQIKAASQIIALMEKHIDEPYFGVRVIPPEDESEYKVGSELPPSYVWENGEWTDSKLEGTSTIGIKESDEKSVLDALNQLGVLGKTGPAGYYYGSQVVLVAGDAEEPGEDMGESVIENARVLGMWSKSSNGNSPIEPNSKDPHTEQEEKKNKTEKEDLSQPMTEAEKEYNDFQDRMKEKYATEDFYSKMSDAEFDKAEELEEKSKKSRA